MKVESLIFDIDGTLWDSRALVAQGYNQQLIKEHREDLLITAETFRTLFGKVMTEIADIIFQSVPAPQRYALMQRCMDSGDVLLQEDPCQFGFPGVRETLEALAKNHRIFIVSNSQCGYPELCMQKLGIADCFRGHLCFGDTGTGKGQTIRTLMEKYAVSSCAYIGDTQGDLDATAEAGIPFIWAAYGFDTPARFDLRIDAPMDLLTLEQEEKL